MVEELEQRLTALSAMLSAERRQLKERRKDIDDLEKEVRDVCLGLPSCPKYLTGLRNIGVAFDKDVPL